MSEITITQGQGQGQKIHRPWQGGLRVGQTRPYPTLNQP